MHKDPHACICPRRDRKGIVDHDRACKQPSLVTSCHLLFSIHALAPDSRPCHRGDEDPRGICYRSCNMLSPVCNTDNILRALIEGNPG